MSIYASWPDIGEDHDGPDGFTADGTVLSYVAGHYYPRPDVDMPATLGISHIPGFIWRKGLPPERRDQDEDDPIAPFLRLDVAEWDAAERQPMITGTVVLTTAAAERLRDDLAAWLDRPKHDR